MSILSYHTLLIGKSLHIHTHIYTLYMQETMASVLTACMCKQVIFVDFIIVPSKWKVLGIPGGLTGGPGAGGGPGGREPDRGAGRVSHPLLYTDTC